MRFTNFPFQVCLKFVMPVFFLLVVSLVQGQKKTMETIKIGLLIPDRKSTAAENGAELAIQMANEKGGMNGLFFKLVIRSMEGPWGTGSKEAVSMIFDENVIAIMGSHDGRNAHLVEQVAAKARIVFLSAWASDPTLSQAFVPWYFSIVPNDLQQADGLIEEIYNSRRLTKITVVSDQSYDSQSALRNFLKKVAMAGKPEPVQLISESTGININNLTEKILETDPDCVIMFVQPPSSMKIAEQMNLNHLNRPVFGSHALLNENNISGKELNKYENAFIVSSLNPSDSKGMSFSKEFKKTYGTLPGVVAAYAYDGMNVLIEAIRITGHDRDKLQKSMAEIKYEGVTGIIQFDEKGNRKGIPGFVQIKNGLPVPAK